MDVGDDGMEAGDSDPILDARFAALGSVLRLDGERAPEDDICLRSCSGDGEDTDEWPVSDEYCIDIFAELTLYGWVTHSLVFAG